jgi:hypothetical protein
MAGSVWGGIMPVGRISQGSLPQTLCSFKDLRENESPSAWRHQPFNGFDVVANTS